MHKLIRCLAISIFLFSFSSAQASSPWGVVVNNGYSSPPNPDYEAEAIYTFNLNKNPPQVYGPFLEGQLTPVDPVTGDPLYNGGAFDVAHIPGTNDALISNFGHETIFRVNFSDPTNPVLVGSVKLDDGTKTLFAEDIAVTSDGKLAIVSNGGFSDHVAFIDLDTLTLKSMFTLYEGVPFDPASPPDPLPALCYANAVAIAPDNKTVLFADYFSGTVVYGKINAARNGLESVNKLPLCPNWDSVTKTCAADEYLGRPVNISISPDGKTALTANAGWGMTNVLRITDTGEVVPGTPFQLWGLPDTYADYLAYENTGGHDSLGSSQSIAFAPGGRKAYILQNSTKTVTGTVGSWVYNYDIPDKLSWVHIDGPGRASVGGVWVASLLSDGSSQLFGVDTLAISEDGRYAFTGNPTISGAVKNVSKVNLTNFTTTTVPTNSSFPTGVDVLARDFTWSMFVPAITHGP